MALNLAEHEARGETKQEMPPEALFVHILKNKTTGVSYRRKSMSQVCI